MCERMEDEMDLNHISVKRNDGDRTNLDLSPLTIAAINLGDDIDGWEEHCCLRNTILEEEEIVWNGTDDSDPADEFSEKIPQKTISEKLQTYLKQLTEVNFLQIVKNSPKVFGGLAVLLVVILACSSNTSFNRSDVTQNSSTPVKVANIFGDRKSQGAKKESAQEQYDLGLKYYQGDGVATNYRKAKELFEKAAMQGHEEAQFVLGVMYDNGEGVGQDYRKAKEWYEKAAMQGNIKAQNNLGLLYEEGKGVSQNLQKAIECYEKEAMRGSARAQDNLGRVYIRTQDYRKAKMWIEKAAMQGYSKAEFRLGVMYYSGKGVARNYLKAKEWIEKAALQGEVNAEYLLGYMYESGRGGEQDFKKARMWYRRAANQGHKKAASRLNFIL